MGLKAKRPKQTAEEAALLSAQTRELGRQDMALNEKKRLLIRSQLSSRASLLSGNLKAKQDLTSAGGGGAMPSDTAGRTGVPSSSGGNAIRHRVVGGLVARKRLPSKVLLAE